MDIIRGSVSKIVPVRIINSSGAGVTGLAYGTSGLSMSYKRELQSSATSISLTDMTLGTWVSGGFKEVDSTKMPGRYDIGIPNTVVGDADESAWSEIYIKSTGALDTDLRIDLNFDYRLSALRAFLDTFGSGRIIVNSPLARGVLTMMRATDWYYTDNRAPIWEIEGAPSLIGAAVTLVYTVDGVEKVLTGTVLSATEVYVNFTSVHTDYEPADYTYDLRIVLSNGHKLTPVQGILRIQSPA